MAAGPRSSKNELLLSREEQERVARREYQDPDLLQTSGKHPQWYIRVRRRVVTELGIERKQVREYLGRVAEVGPKEAARKRAALLVVVNNEIYAISSHVQVKKLVDLYRKRHFPTVSAGTQDKYQTHLGAHIVPAFGDKKLCDITTGIIQDWLNQKKDDGLSWNTRTDMRNVLSSLFTQARAWGYWPKNEVSPIEGTTCGRKKLAREKRLLSDAQALALLSVLPPQCALVVRVADATGMRISEILGLRWKNVDLDGGWIRVRERLYRGDMDTTKTEASQRDLSLGVLADEIRKLAVDPYVPNDHVFRTSEGGPLEANNLRNRILQPAAKSLGLYWPGFGFHVFRRGFITGAQSDGASSIEASKLAGHSKVQMSGEYTVVQRERKAEIAAMRSRRLAFVGAT